MQEQIVEMRLPNGSVAYARARPVGGGATKTSALTEFDFDEIGKVLGGMAETLKSSLAAVTPAKVTVELGLDLAVKSGKLSGLLVEGEGKGSIAVTLEWHGDG